MCRINPTAIYIVAFIAIVTHLCGGNWLVGVAVGMGWSIVATLISMK